MKKIKAKKEKTEETIMFVSNKWIQEDDSEVPREIL